MRGALPILLILLTCLAGADAWGTDLTEPTKKAPAQEKKMTETPVRSLEGLHGTPPSKEIPLPVFEARNTQNQPRLPKDLIGKPTILWFFPFAATPG